MIRPSTEATSQLYPFTPAELARLAAYRAAVQAGLYTDARCDPGPWQLFTPAELVRLAAYRAAVAVGFYTDAEPG
jgi:hypothetical protein